MQEVNFRKEYKEARSALCYGLVGLVGSIFCMDAGDGHPLFHTIALIIGIANTPFSLLMIIVSFIEMRKAKRYMIFDDFLKQEPLK